ncbi:DUF2550 domain-containing protein [Nocardioides sp. BP30]|uniref:DUF2550 domain-containing protein n=1 Tax=Nocardioides sp. BP30 TaxID=3036374 RepID=UPI00246942B2|nr:DUF2550 domain-containing protein [Nocardioides sp. BP30]WGL51238.1 DUF2550 domain-containing protein [Nocardioides sp. BP30]
MTWWEWVLTPLSVVLALFLVLVVALMIRRRIISRHGGTFELSYRARATSPGRGWLLGVGRYSGSTLEWFRVFSLAPVPKRTWERTGLVYAASRIPQGGEELALYPDHLVVECRTLDGALVELAMAPQSLIGFQAWLESRHPGTDWSR